jgi:excisionase family DNA binding protein
MPNGPGRLPEGGDRKQAVPPSRAPREPRASDAASPLLTMQETAAYLKVSAKTITRMIKKGLLPSYRIAGAGCRRFRQTDVERLLVPEPGQESQADDLDDFINSQLERRP